MSYKPRFNRHNRDDDSDDELEEKRSTTNVSATQRLGLGDHWRAKQLEPAPDGSYRPSKSEFVRYVCASPSRTFGVQTATPVAWSPNGKLYAFVSGSHSIYVNCLMPPNSPEGVSRVDRILHTHTARITSLLFHPKDPILISGGEDCIVVWDLTTGKILQKITHKQGRRTHSGGVECMTWACNNHVLLTGSRDATFILWRFTTSPKPRIEFLEQITSHKGTVLTLVYHQESSRIVSAGRDSTIKVWDCSRLQTLLDEDALDAAAAAAATAAELKDDEQNNDPEDADQKSDDAEKVRSKKIKSNVMKVTLITNLEGHRGDVLQLRFLRKGRLLLSGARDNTMKLWDLARSVHIRDISALNSHRGDVVSILPLGDDRKIFTGSGDGTVKIWELGQEELADLDDRKLEHDVLGMLKREVAMLIEGDDDVATHKSGKLDGLGGNHAFNKKHLDRVLVTQTVHEVIHTLELNPALPLMLSSASKNELRLWDVTNLAEPRLIQQFVGHESEVSGLSVSTDGKVIVSTSTDWSCLKYSMDSLTLLSALRYSASIMALAASPDCRTVFLAGADYTPRAFDTTVPPANAEIMRFSGHAGRVRSCALSHDAKIFATGAQDFNLCLYDLSASPTSSSVRAKQNKASPDDMSTAFLSRGGSGGLPSSPQGGGVGAEDVSLSAPVGAQAAPLARYNPAERFQPGSGHILALAFAPSEVYGDADKYLLAVGSADHAVRVYHLRGCAASLLWSADLHTSVVTSLAWGRGVSAGLLFSASWDRSIRVWRVGPKQKKSELVATLGGESSQGPSSGHQNKISQVVVSKDGAYLISASYDQTAIVWELTSGKFTPVAKYATVTNDGAFTSVTTSSGHVFIGTQTGMLYEFPLFSPDTVDKFMDVPNLLGKQEQEMLERQEQQAAQERDIISASHIAPETQSETASPAQAPTPLHVNVAPAP